MKMQKKWLKAVGLIVGAILIVGLAVSTPGTLSFLTSTDNITNPFEMGKVDIEVDEDFEIPDAWEGLKYDKVVRVQNLGTEQSLIRIAVIPRWENEDGTPFPGDVSFIELEWQNVLTLPTTGTGWVSGDDGYYYYTAKVLAGDSTVPIIKSVTFNTEQLNPEILKRYQGKTLVIDIQAEAVHAYQDAYEAVWPQMAASDSSVDQMLETLIVTP